MEDNLIDILQDFQNEKKYTELDAVDDILKLFNSMGCLNELEKSIKITQEARISVEKRRKQGFQLGHIKAGLYEMGFTDAVYWVLNEIYK